MRTKPRTCFVYTLFLASCLLHGGSSGQAAPSPTAVIAEEYYRERLKLFPIESTMNGDYRYHDQLTMTLSREDLALQPQGWCSLVPATRGSRSRTLKLIS